ncbi:MAG: 50S ribosomal protein L24 [Xanthomonadaceae bacterium]|nr:50S ribosomal protein L24 [Xanthomonadaceae bacterium]
MKKNIVPNDRKLKIRKNDIVKVTTGSNKGKTGKVLRVYPKTMRILVEGVNLMKRHTKPTQAAPQGGIISKERPVHYSNVMLMDGAGKTTRIGIKLTKKGKETTRTRIAKTTGKELA